MTNLKAFPVSVPDEEMKMIAINHHRNHIIKTLSKKITFHYIQTFCSSIRISSRILSAKEKENNF